LTDYPPETLGGGAVILRSLLGPAEREQVVWLTLTPPDAGARDNGRTVTLGAGSAGRARVLELGRSVTLDTTVWAGALAREVSDAARRLHARAIWVVMHGAAVSVAARLTRHREWPVHLTIHDDPAYANALRSKRYLALVPWISRDFAYALRHATSVDVIGEGMAQRYRTRYGVAPVIVHRGLEGPVEPSPPYDAARLGLRVGILGSTYSYSQLPILGRAVAQAAERLGVPARLTIIGRSYGDRLQADIGDRVAVEATGHIDEHEAIAKLRECFAHYLNYPFGRRDAVLRQTSFPTKLSTYVLAARPLLVHAPTDSSTMPLLDEPGYAVAWHSLRPGDGADRLVQLWESPPSHDSLHTAAEQVRRRYFDPARNRRVLFAALDALVPPMEERQATPANRL
jgi:hypothetical protein